MGPKDEDEMANSVDPDQTPVGAFYLKILKEKCCNVTTGGLS